MEKEELKNKLTPEQYKILVEKGTEPAFSGKYIHKEADGTYTCVVCENPLFSSDAQFDSGTGWPSFDKAIEGSVGFKIDGNRTEIICAKCGSHLGHVFDDGPTETGKRYCINSLCLDLKSKK